MKYEITVEYSKTLVKTAVRRFLRTLLRWDYPAVWVLTLLTFIFLLWRGERGWEIGALGMVLATSALIPVMTYTVLLRRALGVFRKMTTPRAHFVFDETGFSMTSELGAATFKWRIIKRVACFPEIWLLFYDKGSYSSLPTSCLSEELKAFILQWVREAGGKISAR